MARVGILGGTFDPPHLGHIAIANAALEQLNLDKIIFIPASIPPHKMKRTTASPLDRLEMLRLALGKNGRFEISEIEILRDGASFTVDTLEALGKSHPSDQLFLLIGADNVSEIETWRQPERIFELVTVAAANRPGYKPHGKFSSSIIYFTMPPADISSTDIRDRIKSGSSCEEMLPADVSKYIELNNLYSNHG